MINQADQTIKVDTDLSAYALSADVSNGFVMANIKMEMKEALCFDKRINILEKGLGNESTMLHTLWLLAY